MTNSQLITVEGHLNFRLSQISDDHHFVNSMRDAIFDDVVADIESSADYDFNISDIDIAIARTLMRKCGAE